MNAPSRGDADRWAPWVFGLVGVVFMAQAFAVGYYGDDLCFLVDPSRQSLLSYFVAKHPGHHWLRPLEAVVLQLSQQLAGTAPWPAKLVSVAAHVGLCLLVRAMALRLGFSRLAAWLAAVVTLCCQTNAIVVGSNDTVSQCLAGFFGTVANACLYRALAADEPRPWRWYGLSVAALVLTLLSKETGLSLAVAATAMVILAGGGRRERLIFWAGWAFIAAAYLPYRSAVVGLRIDSEGPYSISLGPHVVSNLGLLTTAPLLPWSTVSVYLSAAAGKWFALLLPGVLLVATLGAFARSQMAAEGRRARLLLAALCVANLSAVLPLGHVSELHVYPGLPWLSLLIGEAAARWLDGPSALPRRLRWGLVIGLLAIQAGVLQGKLAMMRDNGRRAAELLPVAVEATREVAPGGILWLVEEPEEQVYSVYRLPGFTVLQLGMRRVELLADRPDVDAYVVERPRVRPRPGDQVVELRDGRPRRWPVDPLDQRPYP